MAERETLHSLADASHSACGCSPAKIEESTCLVITSEGCEPQTVKVMKKYNRRVCLDFSALGWCLDEFECVKKYFLLNVSGGESKNGLHCIDSEGVIGITALNMDQDAGKLWLTIDAFDPRLNNGEVRHFELIVQGPDMTRKPFEFYVCVGK